MKSLPLDGAVKTQFLSQSRQRTIERQELPVPMDTVTLGASQQLEPPSKPKVHSSPPNNKSLGGSAEAAAEFSAGGALGGIFGAALGWVKSLFKTQKFAMNFMADMKTRAAEISKDPGKVEEHLKAQGLHREYEPTKNNVNVKLEGKMVIKASMQEFFELWNSWITQGFGSINDRQYADLVLKFRDQAQDLPLLAHLPMVSEDVFSVEIKDGKMLSMKETTTAKLAGLVPTSQVKWDYQRQAGKPPSANSFEKTIDTYNGDLAGVQDFYQELFDPKRVNPQSKATVEFTVQEVESLEQSPSRQEFQHSVWVPLGMLIPKKASTLGQDSQHKLAHKVSGELTSGPVAAVALRES